MKKSGLLIALLSHLSLVAIVLPQNIPAMTTLNSVHLPIRRGEVSNPEPLITLGEKLTKKLEGNSRDSYVFETASGYVARFDIMQRGVDVMITIRDREGNLLKSVDRPSGSHGLESVTFVSDFDGVAVIEVSAYLPQSASGSYDLEFQDFRQSTALDRLRSRAEDITSAAEAARGQRPREKKLEAIQKFTEALELWKRLGETYEQAVVMYGLGFTHYSLSNHFEAAIQYQSALQIMKELGDEFGQAVNHSALGAAQYSLGELTLSAFNYRQAIRIYKKLENPRGLGIAFHGLGNAELLSEEYSSAIKTLEESYEWREKANDQQGKILTGFSLVNLSLLTGNIVEARSQISKLDQLIGPNRSVNNAEFQYFSGRVSLASGEPEPALQSLQKAIAIYEQEGNRLRLAQSLFELSRAHESMGHLELSDEVIGNAIQIVEEVRQSTLNFRSRLNFTSLIQPFFVQQLRVLAARWKVSPSTDFVERAFEASERARARGLADRLERKELLQSSQIEQSLLLRETSLRDRIAELLEKVAGIDDEKLLAKLQELSTEYIALEAQINTLLEVPQRSSFTFATIDEIKGLLREDQALISVSSVSRDTLVWLITKTEVQFFIAARTDELSDTAYRTFDCLATRPRSPQSNCSQLTKSLGTTLLGPIEKKVASKKLIVIKDGVFEKIPFQVLKMPNSSGYLIESNEVVSMPSASLLKLMMGRQMNATHNPGRIAVFADPVYQPLDERLSVKTEGEDSSGLQEFPRLFASRFEANLINRMGKEDVDLFLDFDASVETFERLDFRNYSIIHLATHAVIDDRNPESSSIVLSRIGKEGQRVRNSIRLSDLERFEFNADLVYLSACQTGLGKQVRGEGFMSLGQSFYASGARSVIFTGWKIDDRVTAELVSRFYRGYLSDLRDAPSSLRAAQISILRDRRTSHPFYWAGFFIQSAYK